MNLTLLIISLVGYKLLFQTLWGENKSFSELYSISLIIIISFIFGFFEQLIWAPTFIITLGLIFLIVSILHLYLKKINPIKLNLHWDLLIYLGLITLFYIKTKGTYLSSWDEFSYWGLIDKEVFIQNSLPKPHFLTEFKDYPPGQPLFHYLFSRTLGFQEGNLYFAQAIMCITPLLGLIRQLEFKNWSSWLIMMALINFSIFILTNGIQTLMIDTLMGVYFSLFVIFLYCDHFSKVKHSTIPFLFSLATLPLLKQIGFALAFFSIFIWIMAHFISQKKISRNELIFSGLSLFAIIFTKYSWESYVRIYKFKQSIWSDKISVVGYFRDIINKNNHALITTQNFLKAYVNDAFAYSYWLKIDSVNFIWVFSLMTVLVLTFYKIKRDKEFLFYNILFFFCGIGYSFILLLVYCYGIGESSGEAVGSFPRYLNIYILPWFIFIIFYLANKFPTFSDHKWLKISLVILFVLFSPKGALTYPIPRFSKEPLTPERLAALDAVTKTRDYVGTQSKIMFGFQHSRGHELNMIAYEIYPTRISVGCISYGKPYYPGDIWSCDINEDQFRAYIKDVDLFYIHGVDKNFCDAFPVMTGKDCLTTSLYKVNKASTISLTKIF